MRAGEPVAETTLAAARATCRHEPVGQHTTPIMSMSAPTTHAQIGELFLHHRVLLVPVVRVLDDGEVQGANMRRDRTRRLAG